MAIFECKFVAEREREMRMTLSLWCSSLKFMAKNVGSCLKWIHIKLVDENILFKESEIKANDINGNKLPVETNKRRLGMRHDQRVIISR